MSVFDFRVSVIIPVYNADKYLEEAVTSAINQAETAEVILIEDGSPDNALQLCKALEDKYSKVSLYQHHDCGNHGAAASRNLGILKANHNFISFLDADDYYLPNHFQVPKILFEAYPSIDGVYEAVGTHFQDGLARERWFSTRNSELTTINREVSPGLLFESLILEDIGWFHTDGIVVKNSIFEHTGLFDEHLMLRQDTAMWIKMSICGKLMPGRLNIPVSKRRWHAENRVSASKEEFDRYGLLLWETLLKWAYKKEITPNRMDIIIYQYVASSLLSTKDRSYISKLFDRIALLFDVVLHYPLLLVKVSFWQAITPRIWSLNV